MPAVEGLALALELTEMGSRLNAQRFRREHPDATEADVEQAINVWWLDRPGAPIGDGPGHRVEFPRPR